ncbi:MAG TPA: helix-turn-helix transcriptional regulator, partial [Vicinamibacterales bacterium]|nr:helix-turn-helix transcriptional regulator [Vicinamibacterales bacterium]
FTYYEYMARATLTDLELMILLAVLRIGDEAYGVPIAEELRQTAGRDVALAVVYHTLDRLERQRLVASTLGLPSAERGGRAKRYFRVTPLGMKQVRATERALSALWRGIPGLRGLA